MHGTEEKPGNGLVLDGGDRVLLFEPYLSLVVFPHDVLFAVGRGPGGEVEADSLDLAVFEKLNPELLRLRFAGLEVLYVNVRYAVVGADCLAEGVRSSHVYY